MSNQSRNAFTLIELLVAIVIMAVLMSLILPAVQQARESARSSQCKNNLHQMGLGLSGYEASYGRLPPGRDAKAGWNHSWVTAILPYIEYSALFDCYDWNAAWDAPQNSQVSFSGLALFRCPSAIDDWPGKTDYGGSYGSSLTGLTPGFQSGYAWEAGLLPPVNIQLPGNYRRQGVSYGEIRDGASQTIVVMEDADRPAEEGGMWANGHNCFAHDNGPVNADPSNELFSRHPGGAHVLFGDGSTRFLSESIDLAAIGGFSTRHGGEVVGY